MANNHSIKFLRKKGKPSDTELDGLDAGQPLYDMTNNKLYIGKETGYGEINPDIPEATSSTLGLVKLGSNTVQNIAANTITSTASRTYAVQKNSSDQLVVNVPWTDNQSLSNYVTLDGNQEISGAKTFTATETKMNNLILGDSYGNKITFGDPYYAYIYERISDELEIFADGGVYFRGNPDDPDDTSGIFWCDMYTGNIEATGTVKSTQGVYDNNQRVYSPSNPVPNATTSAAGLMSASDKIKLNGIETNATKVELYNHHITLYFRKDDLQQNNVIDFDLISTDSTLITDLNRLPTRKYTVTGYSDYDVTNSRMDYTNSTHQSALLNADNRRKIFTSAELKRFQYEQYNDETGDYDTLEGGYLFITGVKISVTQTNVAKQGEVLTYICKPSYLPTIGGGQLPPEVQYQTTYVGLSSIVDDVTTIA